MPAAFGNIVGLKPTIGSVSARGTVPACRSIDTISVFARSVDEALSVQRVIAGFDADDPYSRQAPFAHLQRGAPLPSPRVAMADVAGLCDPAEAASFQQAAAYLHATPGRHGRCFLRWPGCFTMAPGWPNAPPRCVTSLPLQPDILHPATREILELGLRRLTVDAFDAFHLLQHARRRAELLWRQCDALLLPTAPFCPTLAELEADPFGPNRRLGTFTNFANLCDMAGYRGADRLWRRTDFRWAACCWGPPGPRAGWRRWPTGCTGNSPTPSGPPARPASGRRGSGCSRGR